jgi:serine/threonine-protein kinase HipA
MASEYRRGIVCVQGRRAGILSETDEGYAFSYAAEYLRNEGALAVSLTLPLRESEYRSTVLFPFFDGLIPEGWLLDLVSRNWKIDPRDRFGLLLAACKDCIGDVGVESEADD